MKKAYIWGVAKYGQLAHEYCNDKFEIEGFIYNCIDNTELNEARKML